MRLELERVIPAPRSVVYVAFTEPDELAEWWGPQGFSVPSVDFEARPGAGYRIAMQPPEGELFHLTGEVREVDAPARLAFTFAWDPPAADDVENLVELTFADRGDSTEVTLSQGPFKTQERWELHHGGWTDSFDRLERLLSART